MKTAIFKATILTLFTIITFSCSKDDASSPSNDPTIKKLKKKTTVEGSSTYSWTYEYNGQLFTKTTSSRGATIVFSYNASNKLQSFVGTTSSQIQTTNATYSNNQLTQLLTTANNSSATINQKFYYNSQNQVIKREYFTNGNITETNLYTYDANGNVKTESRNGFVTNLTYDSKNHPSKNVITQTEDGFLGNPWYGSLINNYLSKGTYTFVNEYDSDNFLTKRIFKDGNGTIVQTDTFEY